MTELPPPVSRVDRLFAPSCLAPVNRVSILVASRASDGHGLVEVVVDAIHPSKQVRSTAYPLQLGLISRPLRLVIDINVPNNYSLSY